MVQDKKIEFIDLLIKFRKASLNELEPTINRLINFVDVYIHESKTQAPSYNINNNQNPGK